MSGPRATAVFLLVTGLVFGALLVVLSWRATGSGLAPWVTVVALLVAAAVILVAAIFSRGVGEGRL